MVSLAHRLRSGDGLRPRGVLAATFAMFVTVIEATTSEGWLAFVVPLAAVAPLLRPRRRTAASRPWRPSSAL